MIREEIAKIKSEKSDLRKFGITIGIAVIVLGGVVYLKKKDWYEYCLYIGAFLIAAGGLFPVLLKPFQKIWMAFSIVLGHIMTKVIMVLLFYLIVTPIAVTGSIFRKSFLEVDFDRQRESYWIRRDKTPPEKSDYEKQF